MVGTFVADAATQHVEFDENVTLPTLKAHVPSIVTAPMSLAPGC
jgi:hypothetical protein